MKKLTLFISALIIALMPMIAQDMLQIKKQDGTILEFPKNLVEDYSIREGQLKLTLAYPINAVEEITFYQHPGLAILPDLTRYDISPEGESFVVDYTSNAPCEISLAVPNNWCIATIINGHIEITVRPNYTEQARHCTLTLRQTAGDEPLSIDIEIYQTCTDINCPISEETFTVVGGTVEYEDGEMPHGEGEGGLDTDLNDVALPGGSDIVNVVSNDRIECFYISVEGIDGYYVIYPDEEIYETNQYLYRLNLIFSQMFKRDIIIHISARTVDGRILPEVIHVIRYYVAGTGALQVSLSFTNAKDIDLHVYTPSGDHIYYGNRGGYYYDENGTSKRWGLDVDSNAGCSIDNINNENIFFPEGMLENGTYRVYVNMYSNCNSSIATGWTCTATRGGERLINELNGKGNPANGTYPVGAGRGDMTQVMQFTITDAPSRVPGHTTKVYNRIEPTETDLLKMEDDIAARYN